MLISTALLLDSNIRNSVRMDSGKIAVPQGGGGIVFIIYKLHKPALISMFT
jgi:hypothetical protein